MPEWSDGINSNKVAGRLQAEVARYSIPVHHQKNLKENFIVPWICPLNFLCAEFPIGYGGNKREAQVPLLPPF